MVVRVVGEVSSVTVTVSVPMMMTGPAFEVISGRPVDVRELGGISVVPVILS